MCVGESEKVLMEASDIIGEVQRYWEALYARRPVNLPAFERLVRAHIPRGVPEEWWSVQGLHPSGSQGRREASRGGRQGSGVQSGHGRPHSRASEPVQGLLVHAYRAILRGADVPESWHEAIIWLMPKGTATGNLDAYRPIALGQQDMWMLMTPLMRRFTAVLARKGLAADWQFGAMLGSTAAAPVFRAWAGGESRPVFDFSKAFDTAPHGALALLLRHMGVPDASSPRMAPHRAFDSTGAYGRAVRKVPCSTSSSWNPSSRALPARHREMLVMLCRPWCKRTVMTS